MTYAGSLGAAANPFDVHANDPFAMSSSFAPPANVQLAMVAQNQQQYYQAQQYFQPQHRQTSAMPHSKHVPPPVSVLGALRLELQTRLVILSVTLFQWVLRKTEHLSFFSELGATSDHSSE